MSKMNELSIAEQEELMAQHEQEQIDGFRKDGQQELRNRLVWVLNRDITMAIRAGRHTQYTEGLLHALKLVENPLS
jgi:hypothetical protein